MISWKWLVSWRVVLLIVSLIATWKVSYRPDFLFTSLGFENPSFLSSTLAFLWSWANFDGVLYLHNATGSLFHEPRFLPLLPLLIKILSFRWIFSTPLSVQVVVGLLITNIVWVLSLRGVYELLRLDYSAGIVRKTLWFLVLFPTSFFLVALYSESIFLALSIGSFLAARRGWWWLSWGAVGLASITRLPGILLVVPIGWEWLTWLQTHRKPFFSWQNVVQFGSALLPLGIWIFLNGVILGDPLRFVHAQGELANSRSLNQIILPPVVFWRYLQILMSLSPKLVEWWVALLELGSGLLAVATVYFSWRLKLRISYQLYSLVMIGLPFISGTLSGFPRYILIVFPLYLVLAHLSRRWQWLVLLSFGLIQVALVMLFSRGYFVA
jgi:hypothetical protein